MAFVIPPEAITAAAEVVARADQDGAFFTGEPHAVLAQAALEAAAPLIVVAERQRIRHILFGGDPVPIEAAFREFIDEEEAADCALAVKDLLKDDGA
jgi:hypothetical protein